MIDNTHNTHNTRFLWRIRAGKEKKRLNNNEYQHEHKNALPAATIYPPVRTVERKIGRATFIVSSRFSGKNEKDIVSTIARLVQHDNGKEEPVTSGQAADGLRLVPKSRAV